MKPHFISIEAPVFPCWLFNDAENQWFYFTRDTGLIRWWRYTLWQKEAPAQRTDYFNAYQAEKFSPDTKLIFRKGRA